MTEARIVWRRLDMPGHDGCAVVPTSHGWRLAGTAVFTQEGEPTRLDYSVDCDTAWVTQSGVVAGWMGQRSLRLVVAHEGDGTWTLNGARVPGLEEHVDLDLGFTPATNLITMQRLSLPVGASAEVTAAWLDVATGQLNALVQCYERLDERSYRYRAPRFDYSATLDVGPSGFVHLYPGLWQVEG